MNKPKVFCYYTDLQTKFASESQELIPLWSKSWFDHGWEPIVLSKLDAIKHPAYDNKLWNNNSNLIRNSNPASPTYIQACYERWFAYNMACSNDYNIHWADYDVINYNYNVDEAVGVYCKFDPSYCCGVLTKSKSDEIIDNIVKYAFVDEQTFDKLSLTNNNDMCLLDKLNILPLNPICADPTNTRVNYMQSQLVHFHGGVNNPLLIASQSKPLTRLEIINTLRLYNG